MSLENEVKQPKFRNNRHRAVVNVLFTYSNVASRLQKILNSYNLTLQQFNILRILRRQYPEPACNCTLRDQMFDARSDVTRIVDRLIKENLVMRDHCTHDRRKVNITITSKGLNILKDMDPLNEQMDGVMASLTEQELSELNRLLDKIRNSH
ncbi:MAG: MarR family transcriptional regulator [Balneolales bacterium]